DVDHLSVSRLPDGARLKSPHAPDDLASPFSKLELEDVKKAGEITFDPAKTVRATLKTFDGLTLEAALIETADNSNWLTLEAKGEKAENQEIPGTPGTKVAEESKDNMMDKKGPEARAWAINDRVAGWVYSIPGYKAGAFSTRLKDLLEEKKEEKKPGE
ncbi:MAG: hypothetical protein OEY85_11215, partial [Rhodospirillales bacterium]|nr:hypothetical protein [Rhodospirillales bacterium]